MIRKTLKLAEELRDFYTSKLQLQRAESCSEFSRNSRRNKLLIVLCRKADWQTIYGD